MKKFLHFFYTLIFNFLIFSSANAATGLGSVAQNILEPVGVFSGFIQTACWVIGASFLFASIIKYFEHRRSPLMIPLSTVIFLLIAGILLILLPFTAYLSGSGGHV